LGEREKPGHDRGTDYLKESWSINGEQKKLLQAGKGGEMGRGTYILKAIK